MVNRRLFILGAAAAGAARAQEAELIKTAVIGVGGRGSHLLGGVLQQPNVKVAALCDIKPDRLDKAASAAVRDNPATTAEWRRIIDNKNIDAVFIATPPHLHSEMAVAALQAGKHVYCEKPIGVTPAQVKAVVAAARASKKTFTAGQQMRSMQQYIAAVGKLREGIAGDIVMVKAQRHANADLNHEGTSGDWYFNVEKSGGYLIEQSVHNLDLCNWAVGLRPERACGFGADLFYKNQPPGRTIFDCGSITYEYPGGIEFSFTQNVFHPRTLPAGNQIANVYGKKGAVELLPLPTFHSLTPGTPALALAEKRPDDPHAHMAAFYACARGNGPNPAGIEIGATAALTAILGHLAMTLRRVVTWDEMGVSV